MSRRANPTSRIGTHVRTVTYCRCGIPTRDQAFVCDDCLDGLAQDLRSLVSTLDEPGLWIEIRSVIAGERGIDYRAIGGGSGGAVETGITLNENAARRAARIVELLDQMVRECRRLKVPDAAPRGRLREPHPGDVRAAAEWLSWRVTGMAHHPGLARFPAELGKAIDAARTTVMPLPGRQWLGACLITGCNGNLYARRDESHAACSVCGAAFEAQEMRDWLIGALEGRRCTAAEIADLYDPDPAVRTRVRKRLNQWVRRGRLIDTRVIDWTPGLCPWPAPTGLRFRFGDAFDLLIAHDEIQHQEAHDKECVI